MKVWVVTYPLELKCYATGSGLLFYYKKISNCIRWTTTSVSLVITFTNDCINVIYSVMIDVSFDIMVSRQDQTFFKLNWFHSGKPLFVIYLLISLRQSPHCHCHTLQHANSANYNQGMVSGSAQKMSRERLREIQKKNDISDTHKSTDQNRHTIVVGIKSSFC
jgi:hypothetical protein